MPRKSRPRLGLYYFVLRGPEGRDIFITDTDYPAFIDVLTSLTQETCYRVYALCMLPGRVHLAVRMSTVTLQDFVQRLTIRFAQRIQSRQSFPQGIFIFPYKFNLVDREDRVRELIRFIHLIPCKLALDPAHYAWSAHRTYLGKARMPCVDAGAGLRLFGNGTSQARGCYAAFVQSALQPQSAAGLARKLAMDASASGYDDIVTLSWKGHEDIQTISSLEQLAVAVSEMGKRRFDDVRSKLRERKCVLLRAMIAWHAYRLEIASFSEVAGYLHRDPSTLYAAIKHYREIQPALFDELGNLSRVKKALEGLQEGARMPFYMKTRCSGRPGDISTHDQY